MPGLGPSLLCRFLADGPAGAQPDRPLTDRPFMVNRVHPEPAVARPVLGERSASVGRLSARNCAEFKYLVRSQLAAQEGAVATAPAASFRPPAFGAGELEKTTLGEASPRLAPAGEWLGVGHGDPGLMWALINPGGGEGTNHGVQASVSSARSGDLPAATGTERWIRRLALGGDARRAAARLEIGEGRYAGTELVVVAEQGQVSVAVQLPDAAPERGLEQRLRGRLEARGFAVDVTVR